MSQPKGGFDDKTKALVRTRSKNRCEICGIQTEYGQFHHRNPRRMGGTSREEVGGPDNALYLHFTCHDRVERNRAGSYFTGYLVAANDDPSLIPVRLWDGWFLLNRDGTLTQASAAGVSGEASPVAEVHNVG